MPLGFLLSALGHELRARTSEALEPFGLSPRTLGLMIRLDDHGPIGQGRLGRLHRLDRTTTAKSTDDLESAGYLRRTRDPHDGRVHLLALTELGRSTLHDARDRVDAVERSATASFSDDEREVVRGLLARALSDVGAVDRGPR